MNIPLAERNGKRTVVEVKGVEIGGREVILMAGPCAVETEEQMIKAARAVSKAGAKVLRGGIFKPRTSPYSFQGLGEKGLEFFVNAAEDNGLLTITEVIDEWSLEIVHDRIDIIQIGARNMQNFHLLKTVGKTKKPVVLKRGIAATVEEWLYAAEYILAEGNPNVILCERGIRTYEQSTRNTLDLSAVVLAKELSHLPVIVDPSHATGRVDLIPGLSKGAIAVGADGLIVEMHPNPAKALSDGAQSLNPEQFQELAKDLMLVAHSVGRTYLQSKDKELNEEIDEIDDKIMALLAERIQKVSNINRKDVAK